MLSALRLWLRATGGGDRGQMTVEHWPQARCQRRSRVRNGVIEDESRDQQSYLKELSGETPSLQSVPRLHKKPTRVRPINRYRANHKPGRGKGTSSSIPAWTPAKNLQVTVCFSENTIMTCYQRFGTSDGPTRMRRYLVVGLPTSWV